MQFSLLSSFLLALSAAAVSALPAAAPDAIPDAASAELNPIDTRDTVLDRNVHYSQGVYVVLYEHSKFRDPFESRFFTNRKCFNIPNDNGGKLSSAKVHDGCCTFYDDWDCTGSEFEMCDEKKERLGSWNDYVWSMKCYPNPSNPDAQDW